MNGDRNQKATVLTIAFYLLSLLLYIWGAILPAETRISGTIKKRPVDIPSWLQNEPEYKGKIENAKVTQGWGGGRLILWILSTGALGIGIALTAERLRELEEERPLYIIEQRHKAQTKNLESSYDLSINKAIKQKEGTARLAIVQDKLLDHIDQIRAENGWFLPEPEPTPIAPPILKNDALPPLKSPAEYAAEAAKIKAGIVDGLSKVDGSAVDAKEGDQVPEDRKKFYQDRGREILGSLAALRMSILSAAPTGAGKTTTMDKYLCDMQRDFPEGEIYVISEKKDSFRGLAEAGRVKKFDMNNPIASMAFLDQVHTEMHKRLDEPKPDRVKYNKKPIRLILDDWHATQSILKFDANHWRIVASKINQVVTLGREANVCLYIATQTFNLEALGMDDSNIRGNLAITCQGLVTIKTDENGKVKKQGNYDILQLLLKNAYIVPSADDRQTLAAEVKEVIQLSKLHQVPAIFCAIDESTLALLPFIEIAEMTIGDDDSTSTNVAVADKNPAENIPLASEDQKALRARLEGLLPPDNQVSGIKYQDSQDEPSDTWDNAAAGVSGSDTGADTQDLIPDSQQNDTQEPEENWALKDWYKWLPSKSEVLRIMDDLDGELYNFTYLIKNRLKKTEATYHKKTKNAIVQMLIDLDRDDLMEKFNINPTDYPMI